MPARSGWNHLIGAHSTAGISEFVVVTGYLEEMIRSFLEQYAAKDKSANKPHFTFLHNADYEHNNNIYSLWMAGKVVCGREFLLMDSDILCDHAAVVRIAEEPESALAINRHELGEEEMKVVVDNAMHITEISKTCRPETAIGESVGIEKISATYSEALYRELDQPQGHTFRVVDTTCYFSYELDTPEDLAQAQAVMPESLKFVAI